jgi:preprotein translocase subunit YajC
VIFLIYLPLLAIVAYFLMIRPAQANKRRQAEMKNNLEVGVEVRTVGGLMGKLVEVTEEYVVIETTPDVKLKFIRNAIAAITLADDVFPDEPGHPNLADAESTDGVTDGSDSVDGETKAAADDKVEAADGADAAEHEDDDTTQADEADKAELAEAKKR